MGLVIGAGTVLVVIASLARVWFFTPPEQVRAAAEVQEFLRRVAESEHRPLVAGAGRCKAEIADALCVQTTLEFADLDEQRQSLATAALAEMWRSVAEANSAAIVFVDWRGVVANYPARGAGAARPPSQNQSRNGRAAYPTNP